MAGMVGFAAALDNPCRNPLCNLASRGADFLAWRGLIYGIPKGKDTDIGGVSSAFDGGDGGAGSRSAVAITDAVSAFRATCGGAALVVVSSAGPGIQAFSLIELLYRVLAGTSATIRLSDAG
jgi:hypothetical protein